MDERVKKILSKMTIEEKVAQISCIERNELLENEYFSRSKAERVLKNGAGHISPVLRPFEPEKLAHELPMKFKKLQ